MESALLGASGTVIVGLLGLVGILVRRNGNHNPNLTVLDEKLNQILLILTEIKTVMERCPGRER